MITRNFNLNLYAGHSSPLVINANQYDSGEQWVFTLYKEDGTQYVPSTGAIVGIKSDGLGIINTGSVVDGKVVINETQQMTAAVGKAVFELVIDDGTHGTANFVVLVEESPTENGIASDSDLSLFQQAIGGISSVRIAEAVATWMDENLTPTTPVVDKALTVDGAAADAKVTGDRLVALENSVGDLSELQTTNKSDLVSAINEAADAVKDGAITKVKLDSDLQDDVGIVELIQKGFTIKPKVVGKGEIVPIEFGVTYYPYTDVHGTEVMKFLDADRKPIKDSAAPPANCGFSRGLAPYNTDSNYGFRIGSTAYVYFSVTDNVVTSHYGAYGDKTFELASAPVYIQLGIETNIQNSGVTKRTWTVGLKYAYGTLSDDAIIMIPHSDNIEGLDGTVKKSYLDNELVTNIYGSVKYRFDYVDVKESESVDLNLSVYIYNNNLYVEGEKYDNITGEVIEDATRNRSIPIPAIPGAICMAGVQQTIVVFNAAMTVIDVSPTAYTRFEYTLPEGCAYIGISGESKNFPNSTTSVTTFRINKYPVITNKKSDDLHVNWENVDNKDFYSELTQGEISRLLSFNSIKAVNRMRHAFRVASFNIKGTGGYGQRHYEPLKEHFQKHGVDIVTMQEVFKPLGEDDTIPIAEGLGSWHLKNFTGQSVFPTNERVVATTDEFTLLSASETKYTTQSGYGDRYYLKSEWKLPKWKSKLWSEYLKVSVYSTQLEVGNNTTASAQANELLTAMQSDQNPFIILTGDFNDFTTDQSIWKIFTNAGFKAALTDTSTPTSSRGFYDNVFVNDRADIVGNDVIPSADNPYIYYGNQYPMSDHDMVLADIALDYSNVIAVKVVRDHCTITGIDNWLDRRQTEPVTVTITPDEGYTLSSINAGHGDNDVDYGEGIVTISGNTVTIVPNRVVGDAWIIPTLTANS